MLTRAGVVVRDQTVLLRGVNDDARVMKKLMQELLRIRVVPYDLFLCERVEGILHFCTTVREGRRIMENSRAIPPVWRFPGPLPTSPAA
ncbi:MAG: hypothetical protein JSV26_08880 [bacterium]|nr:MAG: hypothetical protein JSV26_08880 [bacterium]